MEKKVDRLHLIYCMIISLILIVAVVVCWILSNNNAISKYAFDNFAFASTIVSIVLAVVSIVYTIHSGTGITDSISVLKNVQDNISGQIETLQGVEKTIKDSISDEQQKIEASLDIMIKSQFEQFLLPPSGEFLRVERYEEDTHPVIDIHSNPPLGNVFLYCCLLSNSTNKSWNLNMPGDLLSIYFLGYMGALKALPSVEFTYQLNKDDNVLSNCHFSQGFCNALSIQTLRKEIEAQSKIYPQFVDVLLRIDKFFAV